MKRIIYMLVFVLVAVLCSGCEGAHKSNNKTPEIEESKQPVESAPAVFIPASITKESITDTEIDITKESFVLFQQKLAEVEISFAYEECFGIEKMENLLVGRVPVHREAEFGMIVEGKVDVDALFASVVEQSAPYREEAAHYMYSVIEDETELMQILEFVAEVVDFYCQSADVANVGELDCILKNLKVYYRSGTTNAAFTNENCLLVNPNMIQMMEVISENEESFRNIIYHEVQHMFQSDCPCRKAQAYEQTGFCRREREASINPYYWLWAIEGCAEKRVFNMTQDEPVVYVYLVGYVETMDYVALMHPESVSYTAVEDASVAREPEDFYVVMGQNVGITEAEITRMMYAMEVAQNKTEDYRKEVESLLGRALTDSEYANLRKQLKVQYCEMLTKVFYNNLALAAYEEQVSLEDIFTLIHVYEGDMNYHLEYGKNPEGDNASFLQIYQRLQEVFFDMLATSCGVERDVLYEMFTAHAILHEEPNGDVQCNAFLLWLSEEERQYVLGRALSETVEYMQPICSMELAGEQ